MHTLATITSIVIVIVGIALSFAPDVTNRLNVARGWVRLLAYLALTLAICPAAFWLFMLFGGPADTQEARGEYAIFFMGAAFPPLLFRVLPAAIASGAAILAPFAGSLKRLSKVAWGLFALFLLYGLVLTVKDLVSGEMQLPSYAWLVLFGAIVMFGGWLITHTLGWIAGFWLDPSDRKIAIYTWGEGETQMLGCFVTVVIGIGLGILYGLVRFVKWAWVG